MGHGHRAGSARPIRRVAPPAWPDDDELVTWFRSRVRGASRMSSSTRTRPAVLRVPARPSPLVFWARRQALETGIHRVDAQSAVGPITPFDIDVAVTGIEEMLFGFASRSRSRLRAPSPRALRQCGPPMRERRGSSGTGLSAVTCRPGPTAAMHRGGGVSELFMFLWNRVPRAVVVTGDSSVLDLWQEKMQISWA